MLPSAIRPFSNLNLTYLRGLSTLYKSDTGANAVTRLSKRVRDCNSPPTGEAASACVHLLKSVGVGAEGAVAAVR